MKKIILASILGISAFNAAIAQDKAPVVVELFTSQSCSSCPPADRVLGALAKDENIIALSCNVTYWNHLHWEDTLSQDFCTQRQRQYVREFNSRGPYTPQIVINGRHELVGSQGRKVNKIVEKERGSVRPISIQKNNDLLEIKLPQLIEEEYVVTMMTYGNDHTQSIPSGENRGRTVSYTNPVTDIKLLGKWDGVEQILTQESSANNVVILVQKNNAVGEIVAAGRIAESQ